MKTKPNTIKVNGVPLRGFPSPMHQKVIAVLEGIPDDEVIDRDELARLSGHSRHGLSKLDPDLIGPYRTNIRGRNYYGNPRAIAALNKRSLNAKD
jgi:hypothetical protein